MLIISLALKRTTCAQYLPLTNRQSERVFVDRYIIIVSHLSSCNRSAHPLIPAPPAAPDFDGPFPPIHGSCKQTKNGLEKSSVEQSQ